MKFAWDTVYILYVSHVACQCKALFRFHNLTSSLSCQLFTGVFFVWELTKAMHQNNYSVIVMYYVERFSTSWVCQLTKAIPQNNFLVIVYSSITFTLELKLKAQAGGLYQQTDLLFITIDDSVIFSPAIDATESKPWLVQPGFISCPLTLWYTWLVSFHGMDS